MLTSMFDDNKMCSHAFQLHQCVLVHGEDVNHPKASLLFWDYEWIMKFSTPDIVRKPLAEVFIYVILRRIKSRNIHMWIGAKLNNGTMGSSDYVRTQGLTSPHFSYNQFFSHNIFSSHSNHIFYQQEKDEHQLVSTGSSSNWVPFLINQNW